MLCFMCITKAVAIAPASLLAPFQYSSMIWATILGLTIWGDVPTAGIILGNAIIVASGLFVFAWERLHGSAVAAHVEPLP